MTNGRVQRCDEAELVHRAKDGNDEAFEGLYNLHKGRLMRLFYKMVGPEEAEDVVQECFCQTHVKLATFRGEATFGTWLYRLAINTALMHLRHREEKRRRQSDTVSLDTLFDPGEGGLAPQVAVVDVRQKFCVDRLTIENAVAQLPPGYRTAFILHDIEGYEHREIAEMMGGSVGCSKSRLARARECLRELIMQG